MNAYELFGWNPKFIIDLGELRKKFIVLQLNHHPDLKGDDIESSAFINESYNTLKDPYKRYLENKIREIYDFNGVPINIFFRKII